MKNILEHCYINLVETETLFMDKMIVNFNILLVYLKTIIFWYLIKKLFFESR